MPYCLNLNVTSLIYRMSLLMRCSDEWYHPVVLNNTEPNRRTFEKIIRTSRTDLYFQVKGFFTLINGLSVSGNLSSVVAVGFLSLFEAEIMDHNRVYITTVFCTCGDDILYDLLFESPLFYFLYLNSKNSTHHSMNFKEELKSNYISQHHANSKVQSTETHSSMSWKWWFSKIL